MTVIQSTITNSLVLASSMQNVAIDLTPKRSGTTRHSANGVPALPETLWV